MVLGWLLFFGLNALTFTAALALAVRARFDGRAELSVATWAIWNGIVLMPIHVLGWTNLLTPVNLAVTSLAICSVALAAGWRGDLRGRARETLDAWVAVSRLPFDALLLAWRRRSIVFAGLVACAVAFLWTAWLAYLAPSSGWDGIWYHETMVGFAIQNHGFAIVGVPAGLELVNGFPKICESLNLWFVIFTDRRLIELPNSVMGVPLMLSCYVLVRRYSRDRVSAMGWACALVLMPGALLELRSTYIDVHVAALFLIAVVFVSRPTVRLCDGWIAALSLALLGGSKGMALAWVPLLAAVVLPRLIAQNRRRGWATALTVVGGMMLVVSVPAPTYVRNWLAFHNVIWPIAFNSPHLGVHWPGPHDVMEMNKPVGELIGGMLSIPIPGHDWADTRIYGYGLGLPWLVLPTGIAALLVLVVRVGLAAAHVLRLDRATANLLIVVIPMLLTIPASPALWSARYNLHLAAAFIFLASWLLGWAPYALREAFVGIVISTSVMMMWWADPGWTVHFQDAITLMGQSAEERATYHSAEYMMSPATAAARERELGAGTLCVFTDQHMFPSLLWNERFTNRVLYVPSGADPDTFVNRVEGTHAKWVVVAEGTPQYQALQRRPSKWSIVGPASTTGPPTIAFSRVD